MSPEWSVTGSYFEACNCDAVCPCRSVAGRAGGRSSYGVCQFALSWLVQRGYAGRVTLDDMAVVMAGVYSDDETGSPWRVALYVDERGHADQRQLLTDIFLGRLGGTPRANFTAAIATVDAVRVARIELEHEPGRWAIGVEGHVRVTAKEAIASSETIACGIPGLDRPGQEVRAEVMSVNDGGLSWEMTGRCGFAADFSYRADR